MKVVRCAGQKIAWCLIPLVLLALAGNVNAQQDSRTRKPSQSQSSAYPEIPQSELARDNYDRVSASAPQIKEILIRDPGLMVEVKRWIAKEASDTGRIVSDDDLTDIAVFERLTNDIKFRSAVTRLVQRYGYLQPRVNPESQLAKEQDLLMQERVKRLAEQESVEEAELGKPRGAEKQQARAPICDSDDYRDCLPAANPPRGVPSQDLAPPIDQQPYLTPPYQQNQPSPSNRRILQAQGSDDGTGLGAGFGGGLGGGLALGGDDFTSMLQSVSSPMGRTPSDSLMFGNIRPDQAGANSLEQMQLMDEASRRAGTSDTLLSDAALLDGVNASSDRSLGGGGSGIISNRSSRLAKNRESLPEMMRKANPYADIPSLYDLYVQAPDRTLPPQRFGTEVFRDGLRNLRSIPMDLPVGPDYVVGPGDSLSINLWGGVSFRLTRTVDRQGRVALPEAGPLLVSGHSLGEVQEAVQKAIATQYRDTSADVSVSRLRTIRVYVVGEVQQPGAYDISSLSTALNALVAAGGATSQGSLRGLRHMRGKQELEEIDAYDLLLRGVSPDASRLENGDTLMVPPVGPQVTVTGMVRRPAIYELHGEQSVAEALGLAGGILPAAALRHVEVQRLEAHEKRTMFSLDLSAEQNDATQLASFKLQDGDEIHIFPIAAYNQDTIYLQGHVLRPGRYSYHDGIKLTDLITSYKDVLPEPAPHYAEIIRLNPPDFHPSVVSFDLAAAMKDAASAPTLQPLDTVRIFSRFDFEAAPTVSVAGEVRKPGTFRTSGRATLRDAVYLAGGLTPEAETESAQVFRVSPDGTSRVFSVSLKDALAGDPNANITLEPRDRLLIHKNTSEIEPVTVEIRGEVAKPGRYPYAANMHVEDLIQTAGGLKFSADTKTADLTRYAASGGKPEQVQISLASISNGNASEDIPLHRGDVLAIRQVPGWNDIGASVKVSGEVMHPSTFGVQPGERLSSVLARAGWYTPEAYPYGAVLMRKEVREVQSKGQADLIARLKSEREQLKFLPEGTEDQRNTKMNALAQTETRLRELTENPPLGRVVIHIQSDVKQWRNTTADIPVRAGDVLVIPKKANVVMVNGQVYNPTAITAAPGRSAKWYLSQAGGTTPLAEKKSIFVIRADGSVISAKSSGGSWWSGDSLNSPLRAGDTVVVPEKTPKVGGPNWQLVMQSAQLASSVALAVAYIHP